MTIADFPNLLMIFGPFGPFTSQPLVHEYQVDWMTTLMMTARARRPQRRTLAGRRGGLGRTL